MYKHMHTIGFFMKLSNYTRLLNQYFWEICNTRTAIVTKVLEKAKALDWVKAVDSQASFGKWRYAVAYQREEIDDILEGGLFGEIDD